MIRKGVSTGYEVEIKLNQHYIMSWLFDERWENTKEIEGGSNDESTPLSRVHGRKFIQAIIGKSHSRLDHSGSRPDDSSGLMLASMRSVPGSLIVSGDKDALHGTEKSVSVYSHCFTARYRSQRTGQSRFALSFC